jgi:hypothetical protein
MKGIRIKIQIKETCGMTHNSMAQPGTRTCQEERKRACKKLKRNNCGKTEETGLFVH